MEDKDKKRKEKVAQAIKDKKIIDDTSFTVFQMVEDLHDRLDEELPNLKNIMEKVKGKDAEPPTEEQLLDLIKPLIPEQIIPKDGENYVLTDKDKKDIAKSIKVPVVEKEVTKIIEKAATDEPEIIAKKLNKLKQAIDPDVIKGFRELERLIKANTFNPTMGPSFSDLKNIRDLITTIQTDLSNLSTFGPITITGTVNGSNLAFTIPSGIIPSSLQIYDGTQYQTQGALPANYQVSGTAVTFNAGNAPVVGLTAFGAMASSAASVIVSANLQSTILGWAYAQSYALISGTRDSNEALTTGTVQWPDGSTGTFTTDTASTAFPGAIDAYHITYIPSVGPTRTITQPLLTRDAAGAVTAQPALTIA